MKGVDAIYVFALVFVIPVSVDAWSTEYIHAEII